MGRDQIGRDGVGRGVGRPIGPALRRHQARRIVSSVHAKTLARVIEVGVDGIFRNAKLAGDFLRTQVLINQAQALPFTRRQHIDGRRRPRATIPHDKSLPVFMSACPWLCYIFR